MAHSTDNAPLSDTEGGEKPVREQLKKASIGGGTTATSAEGGAPEATAGKISGGVDDVDDARPAVHRKRSHEELEGDGEAEEAVDRPSTESTRHHRRKRSRDSTAEEDELNNGQRKSGERAREAADGASANVTNGKRSIDLQREGTPEAGTETAAEAVASPKTKRSRIHSTAMDEKEEPSKQPPAPRTADKPEDTAASSEAKETKIPPKSAFANTSAASPFVSLAGSKSPAASADQPHTSPSAFAKSAFGSLAGTSTSGFGAIGKSEGGFGLGGGFATGVKGTVGAAESAKENEKPAESSCATLFGGELGKKSPFAATTDSAFGANSSGFAKVGSGTGGFPSILGNTSTSSPFVTATGPGLKSFTSGPSSLPATSREFGKPVADTEDKDEDAGNDEDDQTGVKSPLAGQEEDKQDERFYEQHVETGEEDEVTAFSARAKLYAFHALEDGKKEWRERGLGVLRLNVMEPEKTEDGKLHARFLMRAEGSHRVMLNSPIKKELPFGAAGGHGPPTGGYFFFMGTIDGKATLEMMQLKVGRFPFG
jgi:Ran-binding protein 3